MDVEFRPTRVRGTGAVLLDAFVAMVVLAALIIAVLSFIDNAAQDRLARTFARGGPLSAPAPPSVASGVADGESR